MNNKKSYIPILVFVLSIVLGFTAIFINSKLTPLETSEILYSNYYPLPDTPPLPPIPPPDEPPAPDPNADPTPADTNVYNNCSGGCPAECGSNTWNCWPDEGTWKAAFCAGHASDCTNGNPPQWAYHDVADAVNFVNQHGVGPSDQDWLDRWETGHTWGETDGTCPAGRDLVTGQCYIDGFDPAGTGAFYNGVQVCPTGCVMTQAPGYDASGALEGLTCDCPSGDGTCGGGGGWGYFTDSDCVCADTDPSTDCTNVTPDIDTDLTFPSPSPSPSSPPASLPPSAPPGSSYQCTQITDNATTIQRGDTITYTCQGATTNTSITHADFQTKLNGTIQSQFNHTDTQAPYTFDLSLANDAPAGDYLVQCRVCIAANDCTSWGQAQ